MAKRSIGLQLYAVRDEMARDFKHTLRCVAEMGYQEIEFASYGALSSEEMATLLADLGLQAVGSHVGLRLLEQDLEREINYCLDIGCSAIAIPTLTPQWRSTSAAGYRALAVHLNEIGRRCWKRGITLVYHNHDFDFVQDEDTYLLDILLRETDPTYLQLELDCGWVAYCGIDPTKYLRAYTGRVPLVHLKDLASDHTFTEIGEGTLDIAAYYRAAVDCGAQYFLVDNDAPRYSPLESVRRSLDNLNSMLGYVFNG